MHMKTITTEVDVEIDIDEELSNLTDSELHHLGLRRTNSTDPTIEQLRAAYYSGSKNLFENMLDRLYLWEGGQ